MRMFACIMVAGLLGFTLCLSCKQQNPEDEIFAALDSSLVGNFVINDICAERVDEVTVVFQGKQHVITNRCAIMAVHRLFKARRLEDTMEGWKTFRRPSGVLVERCTIPVHARGVEERRSTIAYIAKRGTLLEMTRPIPGSPGKPLDYFRDDDQKLWRFLTSVPSTAAADGDDASGPLSEGAATGSVERTNREQVAPVRDGGKGHDQECCTRRSPPMNNTFNSPGRYRCAHDGLFGDTLGCTGSRAPRCNVIFPNTCAGRPKGMSWLRTTLQWSWGGEPVTFRRFHVACCFSETLPPVVNGWRIVRMRPNTQGANYLCHIETKLRELVFDVWDRFAAPAGAN